MSRLTSIQKQSFRVIQVGLPWNFHGFDSEAQQFVKIKLEQGRKKMKEAGYENYSTFDVVPENNGEEILTNYLKSTKLDAILIGYGIRGIKENTQFFEKLVNIISRNAKTEKNTITPLLFNLSPDGALEAVERWFSENDLE